MHQKLKFGGTIRYGESYFEFLFCHFKHFKVFRLHAVLHDAAGSVRAHGDKGPRYRCTIGRGPNSWLLGHMTGLLFCLHGKILSASRFQLRRLLKQYLLDCTRYWVCIYKSHQVIRKFFDANIQGHSFFPPKKIKPTKQAVWCPRNLHGSLCNSGRLDYNELPNILPRDVNAEYFAKGTETCKILSSSMGIELENLDDHGCPKLQEIVVGEMWNCWS